MSLSDWYSGGSSVAGSPKASLSGVPYEKSKPIGASGQVIPNNGIPISSPDIISTSRASKSNDTYRSSVGLFKSLPKGILPGRAPRTRFYDPLSLMNATGYKDRRHSVSYDSLRRVSYQLGLVSAILNTRINQVAAFAQPFRASRQLGFVIRHKDDNHQVTEAEAKAIARIETMIMETGFGSNPFTPIPRDSFENFLRKVTRDSLTYDQMCFEIVPDTNGRPYEFRAVDAATIRLAANFEGYKGSGPKTFSSNLFTDRWKKVYGNEFSVSSEGIYTIQLMHGRIENIFTNQDMAFCLRNPRTDTWVNGYGFSEIEMTLNTVMGMLYGEEYNRRFFTQGAAPKGILNIKGDNISPEELEAFRRQWYQQISGVENAWKTPVIQADGMEYQTLQSSNSDMQFHQWMEYLLKVLCSVFLIDPSEINFDIGASSGGSGTPMFESKHEWKIKHSRDKGLRPLLRFIARQISKYVIDPLDSRLYFDFVGLDELSEQERIELLEKRSSSYMTVNEVRAEEGLDPIAGGDIVNSPTFLQAWQADQNAHSQQYKEDMAPWQTSDSEVLAPTYGEAEGVPLYMQTPDKSEGGEAGGEGEEGMEGMGGFPM